MLLLVCGMSRNEREEVEQPHFFPQIFICTVSRRHKRMCAASENSLRTMEVWKILVGARLERQRKITMGCAPG